MFDYKNNLVDANKIEFDFIGILASNWSNKRVCIYEEDIASISLLKILEYIKANGIIDSSSLKSA